jgi:hypothetical protein
VRARRTDASVQLRRAPAAGGGGGVGLIKELLLLPLAPVRGTVWVAEQIAAEAERQLDPRTTRRAALRELDERLAAGEIDEAEYEELEDEVLRTTTTTTTSGGSRNGGLDQEDHARTAEQLAFAIDRQRREAFDEREHPQAIDDEP